MPSSSFSPPNELLIKTISIRYPCRNSQIRALCTILAPTTPSPKNVVLHGLTATGKSSVTEYVLEMMDESYPCENTEDSARSYAIIRGQECITARHLLERTVGEVARAVKWSGKIERCEDVGRLVIALEKMLENIQRPPSDMEQRGADERARSGKFTLVFDGIEMQRDASYKLVPALGRLSEIIPNLTTVFIVTFPRPHFLHTANVVYINFPAYTKGEALAILSSQPPPLPTIQSPQLSNKPQPTEEQLKNLYTRYLSALWDTFASHSARDLISFRHLALKLWPNFVAPVREGRFLPTDFQRLFISQRALFRDESVLVPSIISKQRDEKVVNGNAPQTKLVTKTPHLPYTSQILLLAAYLCSYIPSRNDVTIFSKLSTKKKRKGGAMARNTVKGGGARKGKNTLAQRRRIDRKLLGPQAFVFERLMAVFWVVWEEASHGDDRRDRHRKGLKELGGSADILAQVATLSSLRLIVRTGKDELDGGSKLRVNVGWEVVRALGRGVGVELGEWLE